MKLRKYKRNPRSKKKQEKLVANNCRCGGSPSKPQSIAHCKDRWVIGCNVSRCYAYNIGQGLAETIRGWNRLSTHFYR